MNGALRELAQEFTLKIQISEKSNQVTPDSYKSKEE